MSAREYWSFGRSKHDSDGIYDPWWPLWVTDGPQIAGSPEAAIEAVRARMSENGETEWREIAVVPADSFFVSAASSPPETDRQT